MTDTDSLIAELRAAFQQQAYPEIMTPQQAAAFLGLSVDHMRDMRAEKIGPAYSQPASKTIRYLRSDLIDWLNRSRVQHGRG